MEYPRMQLSLDHIQARSHVHSHQHGPGMDVREIQERDRERETDHRDHLRDREGREYSQHPSQHRQYQHTFAPVQTGSPVRKSRWKASLPAVTQEGEVFAGGIDLRTGEGDRFTATQGNDEPETSHNTHDTTDDSHTTSQTDFDNSHGHDADLVNRDGVSGSRGDVEQENQEIDDIENTHDTVVNIDGDLYPTDREAPNHGAPQLYGSISGKYTVEDNRRIDRNFENVETYHNTEIVNNDGNFKALFAGGLLTGSGFYAGHTTAQVEVAHTYHLEPALPGNNALALIYPRSMDQVPSFVLTFMVLPTVMGNLFSFIRHTVFGRV